MAVYKIFPAVYLKNHLATLVTGRILPQAKSAIFEYETWVQQKSICNA